MAVSSGLGPQRHYFTDCGDWLGTPGTWPDHLLSWSLEGGEAQHLRSAVFGGFMHTEGGRSRAEPGWGLGLSQARRGLEI